MTARNGLNFMLCVILCTELCTGSKRNMKSISYTAARSKFAKTMEEVCDDHAPIAITRKAEGAVVMMSMEDYQALEETAYLLRSPKNTRRLLASIAELDKGNGIEKELLD